MSHPRLQIAQLVADDLTAADGVSVEAHLATCPECRRLQADLRGAMSALERPEPVISMRPLVLRPGVVRRSSRLLPAVSLVAALIVGVALGSFVRDARQILGPSAATQTAAASATPRSSPSLSTAATPTLAPSAALTCSVARDGATGATLQACPGGGPIGTVVVLEGRGCSYPNIDPTIVFGPGSDEAGVATGTFGGAQLPPIRADASGAFRVEFRIPASLEPHQGAGGGPTMPGRYQFGSKPAFCVVPFTVVH